MRECDVAKLTRYFGEGVSARIWSYKGAGRWEISIRRDGSSVSFLDLHTLKDSLLGLTSRGDLDLFTYNGGLDTSCAHFHDRGQLFACLVEIDKAVQFIQETSTDEDWQEHPWKELLDRLRSAAQSEVRTQHPESTETPEESTND